MPLLLSAGYHVRTNIPSVVAGRPEVRVARHLGPDPLVLDAVADRLATARGDLAPATTLLAAVPSSEPDARAEVSTAAASLVSRLGRPVRLLPLSGSVTVDEFPAPVEVATYLLGAGDFLDGLRTAVGTRGVVADPIGVHPSLVRLVWQRYDEALTQPTPSP
jgi:sirohydrochlorin ferrochelatase